MRVAYLTLFSLRSNYNQQQTSHYNLLASKPVTSNVDAYIIIIILISTRSLKCEVMHSVYCLKRNIPFPVYKSIIYRKYKSHSFFIQISCFLAKIFYWY